MQLDIMDVPVLQWEEIGEVVKVVPLEKVRPC